MARSRAQSTGGEAARRSDVQNVGPLADLTWLMRRGAAMTKAQAVESDGIA
ncbi:MAG: hypothetical protein WCC84_03580 [Candidatus Cybelea sp.]